MYPNGKMGESYVALFVTICDMSHKLTVENGYTSSHKHKRLYLGGFVVNLFNMLYQHSATLSKEAAETEYYLLMVAKGCHVGCNWVIWIQLGHRCCQLSAFIALWYIYIYIYICIYIYTEYRWVKQDGCSVSQLQTFIYTIHGDGTHVFVWQWHRWFHFRCPNPVWEHEWCNYQQRHV